MIRMLIGLGIQLLSNALGLIVADMVLDKMSLDASAFIVAVIIFTIIEAIAQPVFTQMALSKVPALRGGVALVATLVALILTSLISDGFKISGIETWIAAMVIVWIVSLLGVLLLPLVLVKKTVEEKRS